MNPPANYLATLVAAYTSEPVAFTPREAMRCIVNSHLQAHNARGKGNASRRRIERLRAQFEAEADATTAAWFDENGQLRPEDVDALAEQHSEAGQSRRPHYHDLPLGLPYE